MAKEFTPYSTISDMLTGSDLGWVGDELEQDRVGSYDMYEQIYWTVPDSFALVQRGDDEQPIYIPAGRIIVETLHRYLANDMKVMPDPAFGSSAEQQNALAFWTDMVRRERFYSKFNANKRMGIIRGDWIFHMRGDPERPEGSRVSIEVVHPGSLFAIYARDDDDNEDRSTVIGWDIIEIIPEGDKQVAKRTRYLKTTEQGGPSPITVEVGLFQVDAWGGPGQDKEIQIRNLGAETFPAPIDQLPVYHIKNHEDGDYLWGSSEMRGLERVLAAVNQSISDEELELVLNGLGVYATTADEPAGGWDLGPARVVTIPPTGTFARVSGTSTVTPHQDHLRYLHDMIDQAGGTPAIAKGKVDVQTAESGIALTIQMGPLLARVSEKEQIVTDVVTNYMFDLAKWIVAYEGTQWNFLMESVRFVPMYGDKIPLNRKERFNEIMAMATAQPVPVIPLNVAWDELRKIGYELPENGPMLQAILEQRQAASTAEMDAIAQRIDEETGAAEEEETTTEQAGEA